MTTIPFLEDFKISTFHPTTDETIFISRGLMEHIKWPIRCLDSKSAPEKSVLVRSRVKTQGYTVKLHCVGNQKLDEIATRLPELFLHNECKIIKSEKKIRVVRMPLRIGQTIKSVYIKQHNALSCWHRLASLFCASPALRSLSGAAAVLQEGYATARPIAAVEHRRRGVLIRSFYLAEEIAGAKTIADYWREDLLSLKGIDGHLKRRAVLRTLACLFKSLHEKRIYHNDLKASNILARDRGSTTKEMYSLIDLQGLRKCFYLSKRRRIKNLAQINRTLGNHLTTTEKLSFIKAYIGDEISDRRYARHLIRSILKETSRQIMKARWRPLTAEKHQPSLEAGSAVDELGKTKAAARRLGEVFL